jgi:hypothetical protein
MSLRTVPELHFHWDPTLAYAEEVDQILAGLDIPPEDENSPENESPTSPTTEPNLPS